MDFFNGGLTARLNDSNYGEWKLEMEQILLKEDLWNVVISEKPTKELEIKEWKGKDMVASLLITESIEMSQYDLLENCESSSEMWKKIQRNFEEKSSCEKYVQDICDLMIDKSQSVETNVSSMLNLLNKLIVAVKDQDRDVDFESLKSTILENCTNKQTTIEQKDKNVAVEKAKVQKFSCWFCREEGHFKRNCKKYKLWKARKEERKLHANEDTKARNCNIDNQTDQEDWSCYFCKQIGHFKRDCEKYKSWKSRKEKFEEVKKEKQQLREKSKKSLEKKLESQKDDKISSKAEEIDFYEHLRKNKRFFGIFSQCVDNNKSKETKEFDKDVIEENFEKSIEISVEYAEKDIIKQL